MRVLCWFSCGAASAVAAKLAQDIYPEFLEIVYCDTSATEHPDNMRFLRDVESWVGRPIKIIRSTRFSSVDDVFERSRYMAGIAGAKCTLEMKKMPRLNYEKPDDIHVFGYTAEEEDRAIDIEQANPDTRFDWLLIQRGIGKTECLRRIGEAGIELPTLYKLGFPHNNCIGCVKATSPEYWNKVRQHFPEVFARRAKLSREIGCRLIRLNGERAFLDELPPMQESLITEDIACGPHCSLESAALEKEQTSGQ